MPPEVLIAVITTVGGVLIAVLAKLNKVRRDASAARDQVQNDHDGNLKDDIDEKHKAVIAQVNLVLGVVEGLQESDRNQWTAIERLRRDRFNK